MSEVIRIGLSEQIQLDQGRLGALYSQLGEKGAESVVCRAMEELAARMSQCETFWRANDSEKLRKQAKSLIAIADQIGMDRLAIVAGDVTASIDEKDEVATAATLSRLLRIGERSLSAIWSMEDQSI
jgi:hypothetical protein